MSKAMMNNWIAQLHFATNKFSLAIPE